LLFVGDKLMENSLVVRNMCLFFGCQSNWCNNLEDKILWKTCRSTSLCLGIRKYSLAVEANPLFHSSHMEFFFACYCREACVWIFGMFFSLVMTCNIKRCSYILGVLVRPV
jgi:hypothetical protein